MPPSPLYTFTLLPAAPGPQPAGGRAPSFAAHAVGYRLPTAPRAADPARLQQLTGETMGTTWSLRLDNPQMLPLEAVRAAVQGALDTVVAEMSHWAPDSQISRFNHAPAGSRHALPEAFAQVLTRALHWAAESDGALDPSMGPLVGLWGFGPEAVPEGSPAPDAATLAVAQARCGWQRIAFDSPTRTLEQPGGLSLDFSGIAKGHGVDAGVDALRELGLHNFLLEVGGELRGVGQRPGGSAWQVAVDTGTGAPTRIGLVDQAVATSGDRWHVRAHGDQRWSHTLDPRTGRPVTHALAAVTVLQPTCMDADALATVLTVLGPDAGLAFANARDIAALFAEHDGRGGVRLQASAAWPQGVSP